MTPPTSKPSILDDLEQSNPEAPEGAGGMRLSKTQIAMWLRCPRQWAYRYAEGLKLPPGMPLIRGICVHDSAESNFKSRLESGQYLPEDAAADVASDSWDRRIQTAEIKGDDDPGKAKDSVVKMARLHAKDVAPNVEPAAVEQKVWTTIADIPVMGYVDVQEANGRIRDLKTKAKSPSKNKVTGKYAVEKLDAIVYGLAIPDSPGLTMDVLTATKEPKHIEIDVEVFPHEVQVVEEEVHLMTRMVESGTFPRRDPNGPGTPCSWCGYADICQKGGSL